MWNGKAWTIQKLTPQNKMLINQREVHQSPLSNRDTIGLGQETTFLFLAENGSPQQTATESSIQNALNSPSSPSNSPPRNIQPPPAQQQMSLHGVQTPQAQPPVNPYGAERAQSPQVPPPPYPPAPRLPEQEPAFLTVPEQSGASPTMHMTGTPSLEISTNTDRERQVYPLTPDKTVFDIGRQHSNTIIIDRPTVSSLHAQIVREGNQLVFIHPHPKQGHTLNGLIYNGRNVAGNEQFREVLKRGDIIRISDGNGTYVTLTYNDGSGQSQEAVPELPPIALGAPVLTLGRAHDNNIVLNHPQVSSHHARLEQVQGGYRILDRNSTNHVFVNGQRVTNQVLKLGDEIRIGPFKLIFSGNVLTQHDESNGIRIDALHLVKTGNRRTILINDISLAIPPRKFVAIVGGSGAGKSTLMDALNGLRPSQKGTVLYNGQDYYTHLAAFSTQLGYVPQDDIIHRELTVERALYYAAKLRLPEDFTEKQIQERINEVLDDVEIRNRRTLLVNKLSGGQRKRVSIALELLANPSVFFLDEPTSGLDPGLDRKMMLLLRKLADKGHTIVLVTHATNNINACDYICFLCQGGRLAYFGPPNEAKTYFGKTDFAEIYTSLEPSEENPKIPEEAENRFKQSPDYARYVADPLHKGPAGRASALQDTAAIKLPKRGDPWKQFFLLSMRYLELLINDKVNLAILILQAPIIGLMLFSLTGSGTFTDTSIVTCPHHQNIIDNSGPISFDCGQVKRFLNSPAGGLFAQQQGKSREQLFQDSIEFGSGGDAQKILFIMSFTAIMFGSINGAREIVKETAIYKRERAVNLGLAPYLFSKIVVLGLFSLVQSLILVLFVNAKAPFSHSILFSPLVEIYITMALTALAGLMTGLLISAIVPNNDRAMSLVPLPLIPQVIFAGVLFSLDNPQALQIPGAFFAARWSMAAMGSTIGLHGDKLGADAWSNVGTLFPTLNGTGQPEATLHLFLCWGILALMVLLQALAISWFLKRKDVRR
jgi:ABC-type multidrug transport system ATPase subunit